MRFELAGQVGRSVFYAVGSFLLLSGLAGCSGGTVPPLSPPATGMGLSASANPVVVGVPLTLTATVTPSGAQGGFDFSDSSGKIGSVLLATGSGSVTTTPTQVGTLPYSATFDEVAGGPQLSASVNVAVGTAPSASTCGLGTAGLTVLGATATQTGVNDSVSGDNQSGVCAQGAGSNVILNNETINKSGNALSMFDPSGINSAVLAYGVSDTATANALITVNGGTMATSGTGAYAAFATGAGSGVTLSGTTVNAGFNAVGASMAGQVVLTHATVNSSGYPLAAINGSGSVTITDSTLTGPAGENGGVTGALQLLSNLVPGAATTAGKISITGGNLIWTAGPLIAITGSESAVISLKNVAITQGQDFLFSEGGTGAITVLADGVNLSGTSQYQNAAVPVSLSLTNGSTFKGQMSGAALTLDATSSWTLTGSDSLGALSDAAGVSGTTLTNVVGNGNNATYDSAKSPLMGGKTYSLVGGGSLTPQ